MLRTKITNLAYSAIFIIVFICRVVTALYRVIGKVEFSKQYYMQDPLHSLFTCLKVETNNPVVLIGCWWPYLFLINYRSLYCSLLIWLNICHIHTGDSYNFNTIHFWYRMLIVFKSLHKCWLLVSDFFLLLCKWKP